MRPLEPKQALFLTMWAPPSSENPYLKLHVERMRRAKEYAADPNTQYRGLPLEILQAATDFIKEKSGLPLRPEQLDGILAIYPIQASLLTSGFNNAQTRSGEEDRQELLDMIAHYYLSTRWPKSSEVDKEEWQAALKVSFAYMSKPTA